MVGIDIIQRRSKKINLLLLGDRHSTCASLDALEALAQDPFVESLIVNLPSGNLDGINLYGTSELEPEYGFDFAIEVSVTKQTPENWWQAELMPAAESLGKNFALYEVEHDEVFSKPELIRGTPSTGVKVMRAIVFHDDLSDEAITRMWKHHQGLATKVHVGMARYLCIRVINQFTESGPKIGGMTALHFPTTEDLTERYFISDHGREEIIQDVSHFIHHGSQRLWAEEYIILSKD